jgi:hypothetical protein
MRVDHAGENRADKGCIQDAADGQCRGTLQMRSLLSWIDPRKRHPMCEKILISTMRFTARKVPTGKQHVSRMGKEFFTSHGDGTGSLCYEQKAETDHRVSSVCLPEPAWLVQPLATVVDTDRTGIRDCVHIGVCTKQIIDWPWESPAQILEAPSTPAQDRGQAKSLQTAE